MLTSMSQYRGMKATAERLSARLDTKIICRQLAQDELSSVVWGMPKAAVELNAANEVVRLDKVAAQMLKQAAKVQ